MSLLKTISHGFCNLNILKTKGDGQCFIYALSQSWAKQIGISSAPDIHKIKCVIFCEVIKNLETYANFLTPPCSKPSTILHDLHKYLLWKSYNSDLVDVIPLITANALNINICILNEVNVGSYQEHTVCCSTKTINPKLLLHRHHDHYSAVEVTHRKENRPATVVKYGRLQLLSIGQSNDYSVVRRVRKNLFKLHIWKPGVKQPNKLGVKQPLEKDGLPLSRAESNKPKGEVKAHKHPFYSEVMLRSQTSIPSNPKHQPISVRLSGNPRRHVPKPYAANLRNLKRV